MGNGCAVHIHHEWVPLHVHHVWPKGLGGPDVETNRIRVCANGHYSIHAYLDLLIKGSGKVPWITARHFGPRVRRMAMRGWTEAGKPTKGRSGEEEFVS